MNILVHKDDFILELFKVKNNDINELLNKIKEYYTINGIQPNIVDNGNTISITIDDANITSERKKYQNLINLCESRKFNEAIPLAQEMASQSPAISEYHRILGQIHSEIGNQNEAINALIDALRWDPSNEYALIMMGNIYAREYDDIETAMTYYDQVVKANPQDNIALNNIAANLLRQGKLDEAHKYFNRALEIDNKYPNTYVGLGMLFSEKKEFTKSFEYFIKGLQVYQKEDDLRKHLLGNAYGIAEKVMQSELPDLLTGIYKQKLEQQGDRIIQIVADESIPTAAKIEFAENYNKKEDVVKYNPSFPAYQHLIMHELVHLELLLEARSNDENELFVSNSSHKQKFKEKLSNYANQLLRKGIKQDSVDKVINDLFDGLNRQIFNSAPDLFIEDRLYNKYPDLKPIQFVSLYNMLQNGIKAVTQKEIVELSDPWVLSTSKTLNIINALQFKDLFGIDLIAAFKATSIELNKAKELYQEFLEYNEDKLPAEEYELVENWAKDLELNKYFSLVNETTFRKNDKSAEDILENILSDPFDLEGDQSSKDEEMNKFLKEQEALGLNMAVAMYMVEAMNFFKDMNVEKIKEIAFEIAMQGAQGYNPDLKYRLNKIPNKIFTGYQILAYYYVSWSYAIPDKVDDLQLPFEEEYKIALTLKDS